MAKERREWRDVMGGGDPATQDWSSACSKALCCTSCCICPSQTAARGSVYTPRPQEKLLPLHGAMEKQPREKQRAHRQYGGLNSPGVMEEGFLRGGFGQQRNKIKAE